MIKINLFVFILSFAVGLFYCYIMTPPPEVVLKFPSPYNVGKVVYKDKADTCYKYKADKVHCPVDRSLIKAQPIYENFPISKQ
jgi:hypothetical protein